MSILPGTRLHNRPEGAGYICDGRNGLPKNERGYMACPKTKTKKAKDAQKENIQEPRLENRVMT